MDVAHVILGRPWLYDLNVTHYGKANTYFFEHDGKKIKLSPSPPKELRASTTRGTISSADTTPVPASQTPTSSSCPTKPKALSSRPTRPLHILRQNQFLSEFKDSSIIHTLESDRPTSKTLDLELFTPSLFQNEIPTLPLALDTRVASAPVLFRGETLSYPGVLVSSHFEPPTKLSKLNNTSFTSYDDWIIVELTPSMTLFIIRDGSIILEAVIHLFSLPLLGYDMPIFRGCVYEDHFFWIPFRLGIKQILGIMIEELNELEAPLVDASPTPAQVQQLLSRSYLNFKAMVDSLSYGCQFFILESLPNNHDHFMINKFFKTLGINFMGHALPFPMHGRMTYLPTFRDNTIDPKIHEFTPPPWKFGPFESKFC